MPVKMSSGYLENGWKASENNRFGYVYVIEFKDVETGKVIFKWAPSLDDMEFMVRYHFERIKKLDRKHKEYISDLKNEGFFKPEQVFNKEVVEEVKAPIHEINESDLIKSVEFLEDLK